MKRTVLVLLCSMAAVVHAGDFDVKHLQPGFQFGFALGQHTLKAREEGFTFFDEHATAGKLFAGYRFNRFFAVEGAYLHGGDMSAGDADLRLDVDVNALQASVIGSWPVHQYVSLFARAAYLDWKADEKLTFEGVSDEISEDGSDLQWGAGVAAFFDGALVRLEYERAKLGSDVDVESQLITLGVVWLF